MLSCLQNTPYRKIREGIIKKGDVVVFLRDGGIKDHSHLVSTTSMLKHEVTFDRQSLFFDDMGHLSETGIRRLSNSINSIVAQKTVKVHNEAADLSLAEKTIFEINNLLKEKSFEFDDSFTEFQNYLCQFKRKKTDSALSRIEQGLQVWTIWVWFLFLECGR